MSGWFELTTYDYYGLIVIAVAIFWYFFIRKEEPAAPPRDPPLPRMPKQDMTLKELRQYDGVQNLRILFSINGKIFDVTRGKDFYGPGGPYATLAGHDATRALATMNEKNVKDEKDDLSDLNASEIESAKEWEQSISSKYPTIGKVVDREDDKADYNGAISEINFSGF